MKHVHWALHNVNLEARTTLRTQGLRATVVHFARRIRGFVGAAIWVKVAGEPEFDAKYGVKTSEAVRVAAMKLNSPNFIDANWYAPTKTHLFQQMMKALPIRHEEFVFVDLGSGKGLAMLLASDYPFQRIIGVEFAADLHEIATANIRSYSNPAQRCKNIEALHMDAAAFALPQEPLVVFIYNSFRGKVMDRVLSNLAAAHQSIERPIYVIYQNPVLKELFSLQPHLRAIVEEATFSIYRVIG